ncbi:hypothetical protein [uncultured Kordia sp.]|uniref:hypothetical protein n=1 Tax=uncultured Kordia sp. TaxID=507699 RepID=UPI002631DA60|nr:hypothetical protein [uncultured Kordia sp.]
MKKQNVKNLTLSKNTISKLMTLQLTGGANHVSGVMCSQSCDLIDKNTVLICVTEARK